ncbi:putative transporter (major facilitator superfamily) [Colletotrichum scovillei]|uniref:Transporter (Major facilitator superfamily) n=1 Tax=Colletotrichum scovillei TaxID=1209932 RepID=A0A9P7RAH2_9PEZI|nr:putative transporter (major facilitator superfamily) [Colletotrichum scovillei]KAG7071269.1 putative transporter (major facilitator superfamily) [Colletotrichum scovillei]KAG7079558.1 putative transporter (major facilitator superfamily) [Colletotrichum scovillei]
MGSLIVAVALVAAQGGFIYGFDSGIIATTFGHDSFKLKMYGPSMVNTSYQGAIVSVYNAGQAIGGMTVGYLADKLSRKYTILLASILTIIGSILQCAAVQVGMMIAGRLVAGIGCGQLLSVVPIYLAEVAPPARRGFLVGLQGMMIAIGFGVANWVGYAGAFAMGDGQWRIPLAMQLPIPILLSVMVFYVPFSPRWLILRDRYEEARTVLADLHGAADNDDLVGRELIQIREQILLERSQGNMDWMTALRALFSRKYVRRTLTAAFIVTMGQLSGSSVIQNFQNIFYATVGFTGRTALLISGAYGMMGILGQVIYLFVVADRWPRTRTLWSGSLVLSAMIALCMALSAVYGNKNNDNEAGARAAISAIFIYSMCYAIFFNAMIWVVPSELFPFFLRTKGLAFAVATKSVTAIVLSQVTPLAIASVCWRYYSLFIATNLAAAVFYFFFLPETSGKSLEEIAELFGDDLATNRLGELDVDAKNGIGPEAELHEFAERRSQA